MSQTQYDSDATIAPSKQKQKPPSKFHVILLNDDFTPMDFVVSVLEDIFHKNTDEAVKIMLEIHHQGRGICGTYPRDIAETKRHDVLALCAKAQHPLQCIVEKE